MKLERNRLHWRPIIHIRVTSLAHVAAAITSAHSKLRHTVRHPLFYTTPRRVPIYFPRAARYRLHLMNIHFADCTGIMNLVQDIGLHGYDLRRLRCHNVTWDNEDATSILSTTSHHQTTTMHYERSASGCTDDTVAALMTLMVSGWGQNVLDYGHVARVGRILLDSARKSETAQFYDIMLGGENLGMLPRH